MSAPAMRQHEPISSPKLGDFTGWCRDELFTGKMMIATDLLERACDLHLLALYRSLELGSRLQQAKTSAALAEELGFVESADIALDAMLQRLAYRTNVVRMCTVESGRRAYSATGDWPAYPSGLDDIRKEIVALGPGYDAAIAFLDFGAEHFTKALRDNPDFMDTVLVGRDLRFAELWHRATNADPLQDVHGIMGARAIESLFERGVILEIGGGTGNGTRHLLRRFQAAARLGSIDRYIFTDVSLPFMLGTRSTISSAFPEARLEWRILDINKKFSDQRITPNSIDVIYGVNAAHIARNIVACLQDCRSALRDGGHVVFAERVRLKPWMAPRELTLNLSTYHRTAAMRHPDYRPLHAYLSPSGWEKALLWAGFSEIEIYPDLKYLGVLFPNQYAAVIVAKK